MGLRAFVESDVWLVAELAYTNAREKLTSAMESMPPWDEVSYEKRNVMALNVLDVYNALAANGFVIMKEEN